MHDPVSDLVAWGCKTRKFVKQYLTFFWKRTLCGKIFKILFRNFSPRYRSTLCCSNFMKCCRREMGEIVHRLSDQKQKFGCLLNCCYCADRTQNLPGPAPNNVLAVLQISSKSTHFRQSYSRMREHVFCPVAYFHYSPEANLSFGWIKMETRHPVQGSFGSEFPSSYNQCGVMDRWTLEVARR